VKAIAFGALALVSTIAAAQGFSDTVMELSGGRWTTMMTQHSRRNCFLKSLRRRSSLTRLSSHRSLKARRWR